MLPDQVLDGDEFLFAVRVAGHNVVIRERNEREKKAAAKAKAGQRKGKRR